MPGSISRHPIESQVAASGNSPTEADPRAALRASLSLLAVGGGLAGFYRVTGLGLPCPFLAITGWWCPLCGSTRLGARLIQGDFGGAIYANPMVFALACLWGIAVAIWTLEVVRGPWSTGPHRRWSQSQIYLILGVVSVIFTLVRNLA